MGLIFLRIEFLPGRGPPLPGCCVHEMSFQISPFALALFLAMRYSLHLRDVILIVPPLRNLFMSFSQVSETSTNIASFGRKSAATSPKKVRSGQTGAFEGEFRASVSTDRGVRLTNKNRSKSLMKRVSRSGQGLFTMGHFRDQENSHRVKLPKCIVWFLFFLTKSTYFFNIRLSQSSLLDF